MSLSNKTKKYIAKCENVDLHGKTAVVTGGNSGIGFKTAEILVYLGAKVILACRSKERAEKACEKLKQDYPNAEISIMLLDISNFASIDSFAQEIISEKIDIDIFINNAGIFRQARGQTSNGFELIIGTNYFGTYRMNKNLLPYFETLNHEVILLNTSSLVYRDTNIDLNDFYCEKNYGDFRIYSKSKLAITRMSIYFARKYKDSNVKIYMIHPGTSITPIVEKGFTNGLGNLAAKLHFLFNSPEKSSLAVPFLLAVKPEVGSLIGPRGFRNCWGYPSVNKINKIAYQNLEELISFTEKEIAERV